MMGEGGGEDGVEAVGCHGAVRDGVVQGVKNLDKDVESGAVD